MQRYLVFSFLMVVSCLSACQTARANDLKFDKLDGATKIVIDFVLTESDEITIEDEKKMEFVKKFIRRYPDGWEKPSFSPTPAPLFWVTFYDSSDRILDSFGIGTDFLVYGPYWRPLAIQDRIGFMEALGIPAE